MGVGAQSKMVERLIQDCQRHLGACGLEMSVQSIVLSVTSPHHQQTVDNLYSEARVTGNRAVAKQAGNLDMLGVVVRRRDRVLETLADVGLSRTSQQLDELIEDDDPDVLLAQQVENSESERFPESRDVWNAVKFAILGLKEIVDETQFL